MPTGFCECAAHPALAWGTGVVGEDTCFPQVPGDARLRPIPPEACADMGERLAMIRDWEKLARQARFQPSEMAALCPISVRQLERFFAERFNTTPGQWARALRCRLACELITQGWSTKAVASELRFVDASHLCRDFRKIYGVPPQYFAPRYGT